MKIEFFKYQGTGNDFVIIDNRNNAFKKEDASLIEFLCHRRFGIGADGLMLLEEAPDYDFRMVYFNADGKESSMCGNGGRCIAAFAEKTGVLKEEGVFIAIDGDHPVKIVGTENQTTTVCLKMVDVADIREKDDHLVLNTGSPHYVSFVNDVDKIDVLGKGKQIRNSETFKKEGINVNFVQVVEDGIKVRTFERGVEDETWSCGTGVTASALAAALTGKIVKRNNIPVMVPGGRLNVRFVNRGQGRFTDIWLEGPATFVFKGEIEI